MVSYFISHRFAARYESGTSAYERRKISRQQDWRSACRSSVNPRMSTRRGQIRSAARSGTCVPHGFRFMRLEKSVSLSLPQPGGSAPGDLSSLLPDYIIWGQPRLLIRRTHRQNRRFPFVFFCARIGLSVGGLYTTSLRHSGSITRD